jgi:hypothetical protein
MAKVKRRKATKAAKARKKPAGNRRQATELNAAGRAQLGPDEERRSPRPPKDDASVEDPLQDWPEDD